MNTPMTSPAVTCTRLYRDNRGALQVCDGPMTSRRGGGAWICTWCGRILPAEMPSADDRP